jgi:hypothetical protein
MAPMFPLERLSFKEQLWKLLHLSKLHGKEKSADRNSEVAVMAIGNNGPG